MRGKAAGDEARCEVWVSAGQARRAGTGVRNGRLLLPDEATGKDEEEEDTGRTPPQVAHATRLLELGLMDQPPVCVPVVAVWGGLAVETIGPLAIAAPCLGRTEAENRRPGALTFVYLLGLMKFLRWRAHRSSLSFFLFPCFFARRHGCSSWL